MKSTDITFSVGSSSVTNNDVDFVSASDMDLFNAEMYKPTVEEPSVADKVINKFSEISEDMSTKKNAFDEKLAKAAETGRPDDVLAATRAMSDYYLQASISTKVASKATSAIDRLTNLQ